MTNGREARRYRPPDAFGWRAVIGALAAQRRRDDVKRHDRSAAELDEEGVRVVVGQQPATPDAGPLEHSGAVLRVGHCADA